MSTGGSFVSIVLDGREFAVAADAEGQTKLGGFENDLQANGDGSARVIKTRVPWSIDGLTLAVDDINGDHEFLQELADRPGTFPVAITMPSDVVWQGVGQITGELQVSSTNAVAAVSLMGPGGLTRQV